MRSPGEPAGSAALVNTSAVYAPKAATIVEALFLRADRAPDGLAYAVGTDMLSYGALRRDVLRTAATLAARGLARGGRCAVILPTGLDFIRVLYAAQVLGAAPVAINPALPGESIVRRLRVTRAEVAVARRELLGRLREHLGSAAGCRLAASEDLAGSSPPPARAVVAPRGDEPAFMQLTSGTTGEPRAAVILHRNLRASLEASRARLGIHPDDVLANWVPLHHDLGLVRFVFGALYFGTPCHLIQPSIANLGLWLETVSRVRATVTASPDFGYRLATRLVAPTVDLSCLRVATDGGEPVRASTIYAFEQHFGIRGVVRPAYGLAEATLGVSSLAPGEACRLDHTGTVSCGRPYEGLAVRIVDDEGRDVPCGVPGQIVAQGEAVFAGYFDDEAASREALRDGWLQTGDVGTMDENGHLFVKGRARALIKRAGATIAPREIEEVVDGVAGVRFSAAVGIEPDGAAGTEDVVVVAEIKTGAAAGRKVAERIDRDVVRAVGARPGLILLVSAGSIPRTANGKIRYEALSRLVSEGELEARGAILFSTGRV